MIHELPTKANRVFLPDCRTLLEELQARILAENGSGGPSGSVPTPVALDIEESSGPSSEVQAPENGEPR